jgi:hypothetical protein
MPSTRKQRQRRRASPNTDRPSHAPTQESDPRRDKRRGHYDGYVCQETLHTNEQPSRVGNGAAANPGVSARSAAAQPVRFWGAWGEEARAAIQSARREFVPTVEKNGDGRQGVAVCHSRPPLLTTRRGGRSGLGVAG